MNGMSCSENDTEKGGRMDIQRLYDRIQKKTEQGNFCLSEETTELTAIKQLCKVLGKEEIVLQDTSCDLQQEIITLQGRFCLQASGGQFSLVLTVKSEGEIDVCLPMEGMYFDEDRFFYIQDGQMKLVLQEGTPYFSETMSGHLSLKRNSMEGITLSFRGNREGITERRRVILCCGEEADSAEILDSALSLFDLSLAVFPVKPAPIEITSFSFSYTLPSWWLSEGTKRERRYQDFFKWKIRTSLRFNFQDVFGMKDIGFAVEKYGNAYEMALSGIFEIFHHDFPFFLTYNGEGFSIALSECDKATLDSIDDMGILAEEGISQYLPKDFVPEGVLSLYSLRLALPKSFSSILYFQIAVNFHFNWKISRTPELTLQDIALTYEYDPYSKFFGMTGSINFLGKETLVCAGVVLAKGQEDARWQFVWRMCEDESISITDFVQKIAGFLEVPMTQISLPQVELSQVQVVYDAGNFSFYTKITTEGSALFSSETELSFASGLKEGRRDYAAELKWKSTTNSLTIGNILRECGAGEALTDVPVFLQNIGIRSVDLAYDFLENQVATEIDISGMGKLSVRLMFGGEKEYEVIFEPEIKEISLTGIPVAGGLVQKMLPSVQDLSLSQFALRISSEEDTRRAIPAGISMTMTAMGKQQVFVLYRPSEENFVLPDYSVSKKDPALPEHPMRQQDKGGPKIAWIGVDRTFSILSIYRLGVGLDDDRLVITLDAALNIPPISVGAEGAGIGISLSQPSDIRFYLFGLAISFRNDFLSIAGEFVKNGETYEGELMICAKQISVVAVGQYSADGSLMALAAVNYNFGGPPAFFVTGVSFGFGYHKDLILPEIAEVPEHPLVKAARGEISRAGLAVSLAHYMKNMPGEKFIAAGVRFTSFNIMDSSVIVVAKFGNTFELGVLGLSEICVPPNCPQTPIAYAGLALEAVVRPAEGYFGVEARLTSESYILSKECKLTGGFALYGWFGGEHSGDMVLTMGGYYPGYRRPEHYPSVPRVGFNWKIGNNLDISGEMYFALTPREIMAGGRLSAVYTVGKLRAYFIAAADFILGWKPFYYEASVKVQIGVSYRVDFLFVHKTFTVELGVGLDLWGPEFGGIAHISWFIISFDIHFGSKERNKNTAIGWDEFTGSFLPQAEKKCGEYCLQSDRGQSSVPVTIAFTDGVVKSDEKMICRGDGLQISVESAVPVTSYSLNGGAVKKEGPDIFVQPVGEKQLQNCFQIEVLDEKNRHVDMKITPATKNLPAALWGKKGGDTLVKDVVCGLLLGTTNMGFTLFPVKRWISLEELYENGTIRIRNAFDYRTGVVYPSYTTKGSIKIFQDTVEAEDVIRQRERFLAEQGISGAVVSLRNYAANAKNLLSEDIMIRG